MPYATCPACDTPDMAITDRHARGPDVFEARGKKVGPLYGYVILARCQNPACDDPTWEREGRDYDAGWQRTTL